MTDEEIEEQLRGLPSPPLPAGWKEPILAVCRRKTRAATTWSWLSLLLHLRVLFLRHPFTASAMFALWFLIFLLKATTPVDSSDQLLLAHFDSRRPLHLLSTEDELRLVDSMQNPAAPSQEP